MAKRRDASIASLTKMPGVFPSIVLLDAEAGVSRDDETPKIAVRCSTRYAVRSNQYSVLRTQHSAHQQAPVESNAQVTRRRRNHRTRKKTTRGCLMQAAGRWYYLVGCPIAYRSNARTFCGLLLAIPNTEVPDCTRI